MDETKEPTINVKLSMSEAATLIQGLEQSKNLEVFLMARDGEIEKNMLLTLRDEFDKKSKEEAKKTE